MRVAVGSTNPVKIKACKMAFEKIWPKRKWQVIGIEVDSGVSNQPMSDVESIKGATARARKALKKIKAGFGVGIEGGLNQVKKNLWFDCGWAVVVDRKGRVGIGSTARIETPPKLMKAIKKGMELGEVNDVFFKRKNSKQAEGYFGLMTNRAITRTYGYRDGVVMALVRFLHPEFFEVK